ncbi:hypothetical protein ABH920_008307 [Catenulispora sp. EB89]|uniref:hypothetical protein n=1 Tax=Catenulispora sp. EB89 TaxID=3156257 RepID=UPI003519985B
MSLRTNRRLRVRTALGVTLAAGLAVATATAAMAGGSHRTGHTAADTAAGRTAAGVTVGTGTSHSLSPSYFGFAFDYGGGSIYPSGTTGYPAAAYPELAALSPATVRWPAGTSANYWVWTKGQPVGDPYMTPNPTPDFHTYLSDLEKAYNQTHVPPVFVLNVMTDSLADQEKMLAQAQTDGIPVDYVELGNELDLCFNSDYAKYFPTGTDYGSTVVGPWSLALHNLYPDLQIAAVAGYEDPTNACVRDRTWNLDTQNAVAATVANGTGREPDAYIMHVHPTYPNALTSSNVGDFLAGPDSWPAKVQKTATQSDFPLPKPVWLTEVSFSLSDTFTDPPQDTYGVALYNSSLLMQLAAGAPATDLAEFWAAFGSENSYAYTADPKNDVPLALTPDGLATQWLAQAGTKATSVTPLTFTGGPTIGNGSPGLVGVSFSGGGTAHTVLLNLSSTPVTVPVSAGGPVPTGTYQQVAGDPTAIVRTAASLSPTTVTASRTLTLPAYSISKI